MMNTVELTITSDKSSLYKVENYLDLLVDEFEVTRELFGKLSLATVEAVNNALLYGNRCDPNKKIRLSATKDQGNIVMTIEDEGVGFDFSNITDPTIPENINKTCGRGLYLMKKLSDDLQFEKNGARVIMAFPLNEQK